MGFKVIRDFISEAGEESAVGIKSKKPRTFWQERIGVDSESEAYEYNGGKIKIRLKDDDGNVYYHCYVDDGNLSCELALDWGISYAGAVTLDMHIEGYRQLVGEPKYEQFLSKDGKWYTYMN